MSQQPATSILYSMKTKLTLQKYSLNFNTLIDGEESSFKNNGHSFQSKKHTLYIIQRLMFTAASYWTLSQATQNQPTIS